MNASDRIRFVAQTARHASARALREGLDAGRARSVALNAAEFARNGAPEPQAIYRALIIARASQPQGARA